MADEPRPNLALIENVLWVVTLPTGLPAYDFRFEDFFATRHPVHLHSPVRAVARMGAATDYDRRYDDLRAQGIELVHSPPEYRRTSLLPEWYPLIQDLTPRSAWWLDRPPSLAEITDRFRWPVFVKGVRQTSRHQRSLSILEGPADFERAMELWQADPILWWQGVVVREYVPLRAVGVNSNVAIPQSFEFRTFWWKKRCVGAGRYWTAADYRMTAAEEREALAVAGEAARRVDVTFPVIDIAQSADGRWVVIEFNDGQDSGHAGVAPMPLWRRVLQIEGGGE